MEIRAFFTHEDHKGHEERNFKISRARIQKLVYMRLPLIFSLISVSSVVQTDYFSIRPPTGSVH
jgi:hypothetical protein